MQKFGGQDVGQMPSPLQVTTGAPASVATPAAPAPSQEPQEEPAQPAVVKVLKLILSHSNFLETQEKS